MARDYLSDSIESTWEQPEHETFALLADRIENYLQEKSMEQMLHWFRIDGDYYDLTDAYDWECAFAELELLAWDHGFDLPVLPQTPYTHAE